MNNAIDRELMWDDEIENDSTYQLIPEGEYDFTVKSFQRGRFNGSEKMSACNKATLTLGIRLPDGSEQSLTKDLFLHTKCEGILCAFFTSIGQRKHGEKLHMNWNSVVGSRGRCKIGIRHWKSNTGNDMESNEIKAFLEPKEPTAQTFFSPGAF